MRVSLANNSPSLLLFLTLRIARPGVRCRAAPLPPMHKRMWPSFGGIWSTARNSVKDHRHLSATLCLCRGAGTICEIPSPSASVRTSENAIVYHCTYLSLTNRVLVIKTDLNRLIQNFSRFLLTGRLSLSTAEMWNLSAKEGSCLETWISNVVISITSERLVLQITLLRMYQMYSLCKKWMEH